MVIESNFFSCKNIWDMNELAEWKKGFSDYIYKTYQHAKPVSLLVSDKYISRKFSQKNLYQKIK